MIEFVLTFLVLLIIVAIMAIGVIRGRRPISGSCGGLNNVGVSAGCEICGGDAHKCNAETNNRTGSGSFYDAG